MRQPMRVLAGAFLGVGLAGLAQQAVAVDGVIEINQAKAVAGGITPGDTPGLPVTIDRAGSYMLTGSLRAVNTDGIEILAGGVTLDLNDD